MSRALPNQLASMPPDRPKIRHLEHSRSTRSLGFAVAPEASAEDFIALLAWLPRGFELAFHDQYYPSASEPGAYVRIQRNDNSGNHGWSSDWPKQSPELLAAWMVLNVTRKHPLSKNLSTLSVSEAYLGPWHRSCAARFTLAFDRMAPIARP